MPSELRRCLEAGGHTTLMVWADCDDGCADGEALKSHFWREAERREITRERFDRVVFVFAKDRLENWIQFLQTGTTDESKEGPRVKYDREASDAAHPSEWATGFELTNMQRGEELRQLLIQA